MLRTLQVKMYAEHGPPSYDVVAAAAERVDMSLQHLGEHGSSSRASTAPYPLQTSENNDHLSGSCDDLQNDSIQIHMIKTMSSGEQLHYYQMACLASVSIQPHSSPVVQRP